MDPYPSSINNQLINRSTYPHHHHHSFLATLLRAAQPQGGVFYDLGSGVGRACMAAGKLYKYVRLFGSWVALNE